MRLLRRVVIAGLVVRALVMAASASGCAKGPGIEAGFWFEPVTFDLRRLGGPLTSGEIDTIEAVARSELTRAFAGLRIRISDRRDATYTVRVVQQLRDLRFRRYVAIAGESRASSRFGGSGAVNFEMMANGAVAFAPPNADRGAVIVAIGKGVGRTAVHELTHQLLPSAPIDDSADAASYEHESAGRPEHYYGDAHWNLAWPLLQKRLGTWSQSTQQ